MSVTKLLSKYNPLAISRRKNMRKRLVNTNPTFLCPNCIGGIMFHDLGLQFRSPTVNLMMFQTDFVKFVLDLDGYLSKELEFYKSDEYECPCAKLGDISIHFTHYSSEKEAEQKWKERSARIDKNNLFVFLTERDGISESDIRALENIKARGLVVFTANEYKDIPYTVCISKYKNDGEVGNILKRSYIDDSREYEKYFDFVKWFNESNENSRSVEEYKKY